MTISYTAGWDGVPADVLQACILSARDYYEGRTVQANGAVDALLEAHRPAGY